MWNEWCWKPTFQGLTVMIYYTVDNREGPSLDAWRVFWVWWKFSKRLLKSASCTLMSLNGARATAAKIGSLGARVHQWRFESFQFSKFEYQACLGASGLQGPFRTICIICLLWFQQTRCGFCWQNFVAEIYGADRHPLCDLVWVSVILV